MGVRVQYVAHINAFSCKYYLDEKKNSNNKRKHNYECKGSIKSFTFIF